MSGAERRERSTSEKSLERSLCHEGPLSGRTTLTAASRMIKPRLCAGAGQPRCRACRQGSNQLQRLT